MTPTPAALAAAEEICDNADEWRDDEIIGKIAEIIDRHTAKKPVSTIRYFTDDYRNKWKWRDGKMFLTDPEEESHFSTPDEILACCNVIETDEFGQPLEAKGAGA